jgi:hypothetical protein
VPTFIAGGRRETEVEQERKGKKGGAACVACIYGDTCSNMMPCCKVVVGTTPLFGAGDEVEMMKRRWFTDRWTRGVLCI